MHRVVYAFICIVSLSVGYFGGKSSWPAKVEVQEQSEGDLNAFEQAMELHRVLEAICQVESNCDSNAIGDAGDAIGPFQIHQAYWYDAVEFSSDPYLTTGEYHDCFNYEYAYLIVLEYMNRYALMHWILLMQRKLLGFIMVVRRAIKNNQHKNTGRR